MRARRTAGLFSLVAAALMAAGTQGAHGLTTAFTYQGRLEQSGSPRNGPCDFNFKLFNADSGGVQVGSSPQAKNSVDVANGLFTNSANP